MAHSITARIDGRKFSWEMTRRYDLQNTAFIWVEDERPIRHLTIKLIPSAPRGSRGFDVSPRKLFLMKPVAMDVLPYWCIANEVFERQEDDTHVWLEIARGTDKNTRLMNVYKPAALVQDPSGWRLEFEDDDPRQSFMGHVISNLSGYGLRPAACVVEDVSPYVAKAPAA